MTAKMITFIRAHKRLTVIIFLWVVFCGVFIIPSWHEGPEPLFFLVFSTGFVTLISAQLFWIGGILAVIVGATALPSANAEHRLAGQH